MSERCKQGTLSSQLLIKIFPDIDGSFIVFRQKQNTSCSDHAVSKSSWRVTAKQIFHASFYLVCDETQSPWNIPRWLSLCAQELFCISDWIGLNKNAALGGNWLQTFAGVFSGQGKTWWNSFKIPQRTQNGWTWEYSSPIDLLFYPHIQVYPEPCNQR